MYPLIERMPKYLSIIAIRYPVLAEMEVRSWGGGAFIQAGMSL